MTKVFSDQDCIRIAMTGTFDPGFIEFVASLVGETGVIVESRITVTDCRDLLEDGQI